MMKKIIAIVGVLFFAAMTGLTVWSRTIHQNSLPQVTLGLPQTGSLDFQFTGYGSAQAEGEGWMAEFHFPADQVMGSFPFYRNDTVDLSFPNVARLTAKGTILQVTCTEEGVDVAVSFTCQGVQEGDSVVARLSKQSREVTGLLPRTALQSDGNFFLWLVEERTGPWGNEYVVTKKYVSLLGDDGTNVVVGASIDRPVVLSSSGRLWDGQTVRFYP